MRQVAFALVFLVLGVAGLVAFDHLIRNGQGKPDWLVLGFGIAATVFVAIVLALTPESQPTPSERLPEPRPAAQPTGTSPDKRGGPYRGRIRRAAHILLPDVSGKSLALIVGSCLGLTAALVPIVLRRARWVEVEAMFCAWWLVLAVTFAVLLYRGWRVAEDYRLPARRAPNLSGVGEMSWASVDGASGCGPEGCAVVVVLALAGVAAWLLVEAIIPVLFFVTYYLLVKAVANVANDRHGCEGKPGRALAWGLGWATVYVAPLVLVTWGIHAVVSLTQ
jgi:hypothetical protein